MPSIIELLNENLRRGVALNTYECAYCDDGVCTVPHHVLPEEVRKSLPAAELPEDEPCWNCGEVHTQGKCTSCNGSGIVSASPYSPQVFEFVVPAALTLIKMCRDRNEFARANVALEWLLGYNASVLEDIAQSLDAEELIAKGREAFDKGNELLGKILDDAPRPTSSSALSADELAELGLEQVSESG